MNTSVDSHSLMPKHYRVLIPKFQTHGKPLKIEHLVTFPRFVVYKPGDVSLAAVSFSDILTEICFEFKKS